MGVGGQGHPQASSSRNMKTVSNLDLRQILALQASHQHQNHQMHLENGANNLLQVISKYQGGVSWPHLVVSVISSVFGPSKESEVGPCQKDNQKETGMSNVL